MNLVFEIDRNRLVDAATGAQVSSLQFAYPDKYPLSISVSRGNQPFVFSGNVYITLKPAASPLSAPLALLTVPVNSSSTVSGVLDTYIQEMDDWLPPANKRAAAFEVLVVAPSATTEVSVSVPAQISRRYNSVDQPGVTVAEKSLATQAEAEAGVNNAKWMSPLRVSQAISALASQLDDTDDLSEGTTNLYFTEQRAKDALADELSEIGSDITELTGKAGQLETDLSAEALARQTADSALQTSLSGEASTRASADISLQSAIASESQARQNADTALGQRIDLLAENLDTESLDSIAEAAASIGTLNEELTSTQSLANSLNSALLDITPRVPSLDSSVKITGLPANVSEFNSVSIPQTGTFEGKPAFSKTLGQKTASIAWDETWSIDIRLSGSVDDPLFYTQTALTAVPHPAHAAWTGVTVAAIYLNQPTPQPLGTAAVGISTKLALADHVHPLPTPAALGAQPAGSYATLVSGKVPADQLPSYVDDVLEFANLAAFPATGEAGKIYVTLTTPPKAYRWSGSAYIEISPSEVTSVAGKTGAVTLALEDLTNFSSLSGTAYKLTTLTHEVTAAGSLGFSSVSGRAQNWVITFRAAVAYDFILPAIVTAMGQVMSGPELGDILTASLLTTGPNSSPWTARFKRPDGSTILTVTSADSDLKKSNLRFVYDGTAWELDKAPWHQHRYSEILDTPPDVATGYFDRASNATSRPGNLGQAPHQVVLSNDTRLIDPRRTAWVTKPASPTTVVSGAETGTMAYDGSFLYILVPTPGSQSLRWARTPLSMTW